MNRKDYCLKHVWSCLYISLNWGLDPLVKLLIARLVCIPLECSRASLRWVREYMRLTVDLFGWRHFLLMQSRWVGLCSRDKGLNCVNIGSWLWPSIESGEGCLVKADLKVACALVIFNFLRDHAPDGSRITLVIEVDRLDSLEIVLLLRLVRLLQGEVVSTQVLWKLSVISHVRYSLSLLYEFFLGLRDIIDCGLIAKLDVSSFHVHRRAWIFAEQAMILSGLADCLFIGRSDILEITLLFITNFEANCLHLSANIMGKFLRLGGHAWIVIDKSVLSCRLIVKLFVSKMEMSVTQVLLHLSDLFDSCLSSLLIVSLRSDSCHLCSSNGLILKQVWSCWTSLVYLDIAFLGLCRNSCRFGLTSSCRYSLDLCNWIRATSLIERDRVTTQQEVRFSEFKTVKFWLLQVWQGLSIVVLREILLGHGLILWLISSIYKVLLPHLELSFSLSLFKRVKIACWPQWHALIEYLLISRFICVLVVAEIEMSLPQVFFHILIVTLLLLTSRCWKSPLLREVCCMRSLFIKVLRRVTNSEMGLLNVLSNLFVQLRFVCSYLTIWKMIVRERLLREF